MILMYGLLSIIVPVYNVEKYLEKCVRTLISQTYKNLQIILVDDGSTDGSGKLCDLLKKEDERIVVIHQQNGGQSRARNAGLKIAKGSFVAFVDGDDYVSQNMYEILLATATMHEADVVRCGFREVTENETIIDEEVFEVEELNIEQMLCGLEEQITKLVVWNAIYRRELLGNLQFIPDVVYEDVYFTHEILLRSHKEVLVKAPLYRYLVGRSGSTNTMRFDAIKRLPVLDEFLQMRKYLSDMKLSKAALQKYNVYCLRFGMNLYQLGLGHTSKKVLGRISSFYREIFRDTDLSYSSPIIHNYKLYIFNYVPGLFCKIRRFKSRIKIIVRGGTKI